VALDISAWLRGLGLARYEQAFRDHAIDAAILPKLTAEDLKDLGVALVGHRRKLLDAISALPAADLPTQTIRAPASNPLSERRQVTVLFADLSDFTTLSNQYDAEEIHTLLSRFFECVDRIIEDHGGWIDKHIGDCTMAVFGAPIAHGNDAERAVRAALAIRDTMPELSSRISMPIGIHIGIASGQVVASRTGSDSHGAYTVTGDTVNLASRLTGLATAGEILVSERIHHALAGQLDDADAGTMTVKGFTEPVSTWRIHGLRAVARDRWRFVGRRTELHQLRAALKNCRLTRHGQALFVRGEAGIGKTRLVEEVQRAATQAGFICHTALVIDFGAERDAIRSLARSLLDLNVAGGQAEAQAAAAIASHSVAVDDAVFLNDLLDLAQPARLRQIYNAMDQGTRQRGLQRVVGQIVEQASRRHPRLLIVEDLHWADGPTLAHLATLVATVAQCPTVLVMTSRIEGDPLAGAWQAEIGDTPLTTIDLGPLPPDEARLLAEEFLAANQGIAERCVERAAGNPLFLEQLLRHAEESSETGIPGSVRSLVQARLDRLGPVDKAALQAAAVLGQRFECTALAYLLDQPNCTLERTISHRLVRPLGEDAFLFAHALVHGAVYDTLLKSRRRAFHRRAADWYTERDPVLHAEHLDRAEDGGAARAYLAAARLQTVEYRNEAARRLVERGLTLAVERADRFALACLHADILHDLGAVREAARAYQSALDAAVDDIERCQAWIGSAAVKRITDDLDGAFADLGQAEEVAVRHHLTAERARVHFLRGNLCFPKGDIDGCLREHGACLDLARQADAAELEAMALGGLGDAEYVRGRMSSAHDRFRACVNMCQ
jgi:class 3 adenylate cyclase